MAIRLMDNNKPQDNGRLARRCLDIVLFCLFLLISACTEQVPQVVSQDRDAALLFYPVTSEGLVPRSVAGVSVSALQQVRLNASVLDTPLNQVFKLVINQQRQFQVVFTQRIVHPDGAISLNGFLSNLGSDFSVNLTVNGASVFGRILTPQGIVSVTSDVGAVWIVDTAASGLQAAGSASDQKSPANTRILKKTSPTVKNKIEARNNHLSMIDVLILYSTGFEARYTPSELSTRITALFNLANSALANSEIQLRFRLVHSAAVGYDDTINNDTALVDLSDGNGVFQVASSLRDQYGADLVAFLRPFVNDGSNSCGSAWLNGVNGSPLSPDLIYSVISDGQDGRFFCDDLTLAHELGHSLGSSHDVGNADGVGIYPYSYGYGVPGSFGTVMSYITPQAGKYSNPKILTCFGNACGVENQADNARSMNQTRSIVEAFRNSVSTIQGLPEALTLEATNIGSNNADLHATISSGNLATEAIFEYGTSSGTYTQQTTIQNIGADVVKQDITETISGLSCGTTYYFRATATNSDGTANGDELSLTTLNCSVIQPRVETKPASNFDVDAATLNGAIHTQGNSATYYFEYGETADFGLNTAVTIINNSALSPVSERLTGLQCSTRYQYRLVLDVEGQKYLGDTMSFVTNVCVDTTGLSTPEVTQITETSAHYSTSVSGGAAGDVIHFEYGLGSNLNLKTAEQTYDTTNTFIADVADLQCANDYSVRAVLDRGGKIYKSTTKTFTSADCQSNGQPPLLVTGEVQGLGQTGATLTATLNPTTSTAQVFFQYGITQVDEVQTTSEIHSSPTTATIVKQFVSGLTCDSSYKYRVGASIQGELIYGDTLSFLTNPCVSTNAMLETLDPEVSPTGTVTFKASVDPSGIPTKVYFEYGVGESLDSVTPQYSVGDGVLRKTFTWEVNGLKCGTSYQYRAMAISTPVDGSDEIIHAGSILSFVTAPCEAVKIVGVNVWSTNKSASIDIILNTSGETTDFYLSYGTTDQLEQTTTTYQVTSGTVHIQLTQLECDTVYYFKPVATNINGGLIGEQDSFQTQACALAPLAVTEPAVDVGGHSATLVAKVSPNGSATTAYFEYGLDENFGTSTQPENVGVSFVDQFVKHEATGLDCETKYNYRIFSSNENGIVKGEILSFVTAQCGDDIKPIDSGGSRILAADGDFSVVIGSGGSVIAWGDNTSGQLGVDDSGVGEFAGIKNSEQNTIQNVVKLAAGKQHVLALKGDSTVLAWGKNSSGQLGSGDKASVVTPQTVSNGNFGNLFSVVDIDAGENHSVALLADGTLRSWGENGLGQLGTASKGDSSVPMKVEGIENIIAISAGDNHSLALDKEGRVFSWGANNYGQLGIDSDLNKLQPTKVLIDAVVTKVFSGENFSFALDENKQLWAWGDNQFGQLGLGDRQKRLVPEQVDLNELPFPILDIAAGQGHVVALLENGTVFGWGDNSQGQLARPYEEVAASEIPVEIYAEPGKPLDEIVAIAAGHQHSIALNEAGNLLAWGDASKGQLGFGLTAAKSDGPVVVSDAGGVSVSLKVPRIIVSAESLTIDEGGDETLFVRLSSQPADIVSIKLQLIDEGNFSIAEGDAITFTRENWDKDQQIVIAVGTDDDHVKEHATLSIKADGYIERRVNLIENDRLPLPKPPPVAALDAIFLLMMALFLVGRSQIVRMNPGRPGV